MIRYLLPILLSLSLSACEDTNLFMVTGAVTDAVTAITLSDKQVNSLARQAAYTTDSKHQIAPQQSDYDQRIRRLLKGISATDQTDFNVKVYLAKDINAFAMADGSIRIYSGLMELMNDQELLFVIGHEMGHVIKKHSREKMVLAYAASALRKGLASQQNEIGQLAGSMVGGLVEQLTSAQYSQHEEREADRYGVKLLTDKGYDTGAAVTALQKLAALPGRHTFFSSHPAPEARIGALLKYGKEDKEHDSVTRTVFGYAKRVVILLLRSVGLVIKWLLSLL
jgi:putative metalloprotease